MKFEYSAVAKYLDEKNPPFVPPEGGPTQLRADIVMAASWLIQVYDKIKRRVPDDMYEAFEDLRDVIGDMNEKDICDKLLIVVNKLVKTNHKLWPVTMFPVQGVLLTLVDRG